MLKLGFIAFLYEQGFQISYLFLVYINILLASFFLEAMQLLSSKTQLNS